LVREPILMGPSRKTFWDFFRKIQKVYSSCKETRERIRQIEAKAHEKIRQHGNINKLRSY